MILYTITTQRGHTFNRIAWTGGNPPPRNWENCLENQDLIQAFLQDQLTDLGQTPTPEQLSIFTNRAIFDAYATTIGQFDRK